MEVKYVDHMGSDATVVNAARVSFSKHKDITDTVDEKDVKLINYLAKHNHWSPFAHTSIQLRIKAPIFVARQLGKHQVGGVWNEISRRYVDTEPEFFYPEKWRGRPVNKKQGSSDVVISEIVTDESIGESESIDTLVKMHIQQALELYSSMLEAGVAPEQARMILPQNMMTEWYWTGSLVFFNRIVGLRLESDTQEETRVIAQQIFDICKEKFPESWKALNSI